MNDRPLILTRCSFDAQLIQRPSTQYLEEYVLPVLLPGLEALLMEAQKHHCMERKKMAFNGCDFLTEWLYNKNPRQSQRIPLNFHKIPFVQDWLLEHPRQCIPVSLFLTDEQAALLIQAFWRGYKEKDLPKPKETSWRLHKIACVLQTEGTTQPTTRGSPFPNTNLDILTTPTLPVCTIYGFFWGLFMPLFI